MATALPAASAAAAKPAKLLEVPVVVRVASCADKRPVRTDAWVKAHLEAANRLLAPHRIRLRPRIEPFVPAACELLARKDRDALALHAAADGVAVLVVRRARDLDLPSYNLMGVHWRYGGSDAALKGRRWVILTARARPPVLAHELCHYFGLPHDAAGGNLMTPGPSAAIWRGKRSKPAPFKPLLTAGQARCLRRGIVRWLRGSPGAEAKAKTRAEGEGP